LAMIGLLSFCLHPSPEARKDQIKRSNSAPKRASRMGITRMLLGEAARLV
jgi:hypothetical protein